jgi:formate-nitrite transporter family protein
MAEDVDNDFDIVNEYTVKTDKPKDASQILNEQIEESIKGFSRGNISTFISSFTAGLEIGFSVLLMGTIYTLFGEQMSNSQLTMILAICYPLGFIFVIIGRSDLFTEHTALAILPVLNRSANLKDLFRLWGVIYAGNIVGGYFFSIILDKVGVPVGFVNAEAITYLAFKVIDHSWNTMLLSAMFAGWMMGLLGWLITSSQETISRIIMIILVTTIIGVTGLHHCIVGSIEVFSGFLISDQITFTDYLQFQLWATLGNAAGGTIFVAILKFSYIRAKN